MDLVYTPAKTWTSPLISMHGYCYTHGRRSRRWGGGETGGGGSRPPIFLMGLCSNRLTIIVGCVLFPLSPQPWREIAAAGYTPARHALPPYKYAWTLLYTNQTCTSPYKHAWTLANQKSTSRTDWTEREYFTSSGAMLLKFYSQAWLLMLCLHNNAFTCPDRRVRVKVHQWKSYNFTEGGGGGYLNSTVRDLAHSVVYGNCLLKLSALPKI